MVIIFDWDGTLHDSKQALVNAWTRTGERFGLSLSPQRILASMGPGIHSICDSLGFPQQDREASARTAVEEFQSEILRAGSLFPGARDVLEELRDDNKLAIYSNGFKHIVGGLIEKHGLEHYFDVVIASDTALKPSREGIDVILSHVGERTGVMIDDAPEGILAAKNAGIPSIGALYGIHPDSLLLSRPHAMVKDVREIPQAVRRLC